MSPRVSIVIVNYNGVACLPELFASLEQQSLRDFEVIVVDNASTDDSLRYLESQKQLKLIHSNENLGFAAGCNLGAKLAGGEYVFLLNNDTKLDPGCLEKLVEALDKDPKRGAVVAKIYLDKPSLQGKKVLDSAGSLFNNIGSCWSRGYLEEDRGQYDQEEQVPMGTACALLFRKEILDKTYLFDEAYFMYVEEFDFNLRVRGLGYEVWYIPGAVVYHKTSQAVRKEAAKQQVKSGLYKQRFGNRNRAKVLAKYYPVDVLLNNAHLILASYLYWNFKFLFKQGPVSALGMLLEELSFWRAGWQERSAYVKTHKYWREFMLNNSLWDLHLLSKDIKQKRLTYGE